MSGIPDIEIFPDVEESGLFRIYIDTKSLIEAGTENELTPETSSSDFAKKITSKIKLNYISLLKSISNSRCANLPDELLKKLFDEDGSNYSATSNNSIYGLLFCNDIIISDFYDINGNNLTAKCSVRESNIAYFTFNMQFKYKLLDFIIQVEIGHGIYNNQNDNQGDLATIPGNLLICGSLEVANETHISGELTIDSQTILHNTLQVQGASTFKNSITVGDEATSYSLLVYGGNENDDKYMKWCGANSLLQINGDLKIGSPDTNNNGENDNSHLVIFYGKNADCSLIWDFDSEDSENKLKLNDSSIYIENNAIIDGNIQIGCNESNLGSNVKICGTTSDNYIEWNNNLSLNKLQIFGAVDIGDCNKGFNVNIYSDNTDKYIKWVHNTETLSIRGVVEIGNSNDNTTSDQVLIWGSNGKYINWNNQQNNKLEINGCIEQVEGNQLILNSCNSSQIEWDGVNGIFSNTGISNLSNTTISNSLICGTNTTECGVTLYGTNSNKVSWTANKLDIIGNLEVSGDTILATLETTDNVTINGTDNSCNYLKWIKNDNKLQVNGTTVLNGNVEIHDVTCNNIATTVEIDSAVNIYGITTIKSDVYIGEHGTNRTFQVFGITDSKYLTWTNDKLLIRGDFDLFSTHSKLNGEILINTDIICHANGKIDINNDATLNNNVNITNLLKVTGSILSEASDVKKWTWNDNNDNTFQLNCDLLMLTSNMTLTDSNLIINSCNNSGCITWTSSTELLEIRSENIKIISDFELQNDLNNYEIKWFKDNSLLECKSNLHTFNDIVINCSDNNCNYTVEWDSNVGLLSVKSDFKLENITGSNRYIEWDSSNSNLTCDAKIITCNDICINGANQKIIEWTSTNSTLSVNSIVHLKKADNTVGVTWNNDRLTINSQLDINNGIINIFSSTSNEARIIWSPATEKGNLQIKSDINYSDGIININGDSNSNIMWTKTTGLTLTQCSLKLVDTANTTSIIWTPGSDLCILSEVNVKGDLNIFGNDSTTNDLNVNSDKYIKWDSCNSNLDIDINDITCKANDLTFTLNDMIINVENCLAVKTGNCNKILWNNSLDQLEINTKLILNGDSNTKNITWYNDENKLESNADTVLLNGTSNSKVEWNNNKLTVSSQFVKTPNNMPNICGNQEINFENFNNFHLTITGDVTLTQPINACPGQEGRIIFINNNNTSYTINFDNSYWYVEREHCTNPKSISINGNSSINVFVYYVLASNQILLRLEKDYINTCAISDC